MFQKSGPVNKLSLVDSPFRMHIVQAAEVCEVSSIYPRLRPVGMTYGSCLQAVV